MHVAKGACRHTARPQHLCRNSSCHRVPAPVPDSPRLASDVPDGSKTELARQRRQVGSSLTSGRRQSNRTHLTSQAGRVEPNVIDGIPLTRARDAPGDLPVVPMCRRCFACRDGQITGTFPRVPRPIREGRFAIVTNVGCGMRWTQVGATDESASSRTTKPCGLSASTLARSRPQCSRIAPVTVTKKARSPERARNKS